MQSADNGNVSQADDIAKITQVVSDAIKASMPHHPPLDGLLHLGAVVTTLLLAYLGLDRLSKIDDPVGKEISAIESKMQDKMLEEGYLDPDKSAAYEGPAGLKGDDRLRVLCYIANVPGVDAPRLSHLLIRFARWRLHKKIIWITAAPTFMLFLGLVLVTTWPEHFEYFVQREFIDAAFGMFMLQIAVILAALFIAQNLANRIAAKGENALNDLKSLVKDVGNFSVKQGYVSQAQVPLAPAEPG